MSATTYTVTVGKGKAVHTASNGATLCGTEKRANDTLVLLNSNADNTCKNCAKLIPAVDTAPVEEETEDMDTDTSDRLNRTTDAGRFIMACKGYDVDLTEASHRTTVTVRRTYSDRKVTLVACWNPDGTWAYGRVVIVQRGGHTVADLSESDVAEMTYSVDPRPSVYMRHDVAA